MFEKLKKRLRDRFGAGEHQMCYLYDEIMQHFGVDGIEGEELATVMMRHLHNEGFIKERRNLFMADMFEMRAEIDDEIERFVAIHGEKERRLITNALQWLAKTQPGWGLGDNLVDHKDFIDHLLDNMTWVDSDESEIDDRLIDKDSWGKGYPK